MKDTGIGSQLVSIILDLDFHELTCRAIVVKLMEVVVLELALKSFSQNSSPL